MAAMAAPITAVRMVRAAVNPADPAHRKPMLHRRVAATEDTVAEISAEDHAEITARHEAIARRRAVVGIEAVVTVAAEVTGGAVEAEEAPMAEGDLEVAAVRMAAADIGKSLSRQEQPRIFRGCFVYGRTIGGRTGARYSEIQLEIRTASASLKGNIDWEQIFFETARSFSRRPTCIQRCVCSHGLRGCVRFTGAARQADDKIALKSSQNALSSGETPLIE